MKCAALQFNVRNGFTRLKDPSQMAFNCIREVWSNFPNGETNVRGSGNPVDFRDFVVDPQKAHVAAKYRQSDRQRAIQQIEFRKLQARPGFALRQRVVCLLGILAERFITNGATQCLYLSLATL